MIPSLCLAALALLPFQDQRDLSCLAPSDSLLLIAVDSRDMETHALHEFLVTLMKAREGLPALLGPRGRDRFEAALEFTKGWPDLPIGRSIANLARGGFLFGQVRASGPEAAEGKKPDPFVIMAFATADQAKQAREVLSTWLSLGKLLGNQEGQEILDSLVQSGTKLVFARPEILRRGILERISGKQDSSTARFSNTFFAGKGGTLARLRLWVDLSSSLAKKNFTNIEDQPFAAMLFSGLYDGLKEAGQIRFRVDLSAKPQPRLSLGIQLPGFRKGLSSEALSVWDAGESWLPVRSEDQILRFRIARDFPSLVKSRSKLLSTQGQAELDKFLQGLEFGFQGAQAETRILPDLSPGFSGMAELGNEQDRVQEGPDSYCLPQGLLAFGHKGAFLAEKVSSALRLFVVAGNSNRKRRGQDLYRIQSGGEDGINLSTARIATRNFPRPLAASFSPSVASSRTTFYFSSSPQLCRSLFKSGERELSPAMDGLSSGNLLEVSGPNLSLSLLQNLDLARSQMVLRQGISYARAEKRLRFIARLLAAAGHLDYRDGFRGEDLEAALVWSPGSELLDPGFWSTKRRESLR